MLRFRRERSLQKFVAIHSSIFNHFNHQRHLNIRENFKLQRNAVLAKWHQFLCCINDPQSHHTETGSPLSDSTGKHLDTENNNQYAVYIR
jgi:hypothetical protein